MCTRFCLCPPRVSVSPALWKLCDQILLTFKFKVPESFQSICQIPRLGNLLFGLEVSQQCKNFFGIIVLQFVVCLLSSSMVGLMRRTSQVCCSQSPCPQARPLLTHAFAGENQTLKCRDPSLLWDPWILVHTRFCLSPPSISDGYGV